MTGDGNWTWLLAGRVPTLIDAGTGDPRHLDALAAALGGEQLVQVLVTHAHTDHASGAAALAARFPGVRFRKMPWVERDVRHTVDWEPLADGARVEAGDVVLRAVHTPGHAPDHLCFFHDESGGLFGGDLLVKGITVWIPGDTPGAMAAYMQSLRRVMALRPARIYPAHGSVIDEPSMLLEGTLAHRLEREGQVLEVLQSGRASATAVARRIYRGLDERLLPFAEQSVTAHLMKLEDEGRVSRGAEAWSIIEP